MGIETFDYNSLLEISRRLGLPIKKLLDMFWALKTEDLDNNELLRRIGVSRNSLNQAKEMLESFLTLSSTKTVLSEQGKVSVSALFPEHYAPEESMWSFLENDPQYGEVVMLLERNESYRTKPRKELDQYRATLNSEARRALLMNFFGDIKGKRTLFLGVDFTSVATSWVGGATDVQVLDIDQDLLSGVMGAATTEKLAINSAKYDARQLLPKQFDGHFDVVFIDPPYTISGFELFMSRAVQALDRDNQAARIYACYGSSDRAKERFLPVYEAIFKSGLMPRWVFDKFNRYQEGAESIGSTSSLFVCDVTPKTKPLFRGVSEANIYTR